MDQEQFIPEQDRADNPRIKPLLVEFAKQMIEPPGGDERIAKFCQAMLEVSYNRHIPTEDQATVKQAISSVFACADNHDIEPAYCVNKLLRCFQKQFMYRLDEPYPYSDRSADPWREAIINVLKSDNLDEVLTDIKTRETQSNVVQRYASLRFLLNLCVDRQIEAPSVLDIGCSQNLGLKKIASGGIFDDLTVVEEGSNPKYFRMNQRQSRNLNRIIASPLRLGRSLGVDLFDLQDHDNVEWVHACSSYPSELLNTARLQEAYELEAVNLHSVNFTQADITSHLAVATSEGTMKERRLYDVVFASTSMYQMTDSQREKTYQKVYDHLKESGMMVVQDFVSLQHGKLQFSGPGSDKFAYRTFVKDKQSDYDDPQEIFDWETARCIRLKLGLGKISIEGSDVTIAELLASNKVAR